MTLKIYPLIAFTRTPLKAKLEKKENYQRELFISEATKDDSAARFYTEIPSLALLLAIFSILKPAAKKLKYWVKGESNQAGKYGVRFFPLLNFIVFFNRQ